MFNTNSALGTDFSTPQIITLTSGELELSTPNETVTITGPAAGVTVSGDRLSRVFQVDAEVTASISGVTITGGSEPTHDGGGLYNLGTTTLTDCSVSGNSAAGGGGIDNGRGAAITLTNCAISGNSAIGRVSGGIVYDGVGGGMCGFSDSQATLINCIITNNTAGRVSGGNVYAGEGGGMFGVSDSQATLINCIITNNTALGSAGGLSLGSGNLTDTLVGCVLSGNSATASGGALLAAGINLSLTNCTFSANSAGLGGAAYLIDFGSDTLTNCAISGNTATGHGLYDQSGGGLYLGFGNNTTLMNCTVSGNSAFANGGGIAAEGAMSGNNTTLVDCTIFGNSTGQSGGGVSNEGLVAEVITDCTISGNFADQSGGGVTSIVGGGKICEPTISNTILAGNTALVSGPDGNITFVSNGNNLIGNTSGSTGWVASDLTGTSGATKDPLLAPLGNFGGPTQTMALLAGSPALGAAQPRAVSPPISAG